MNDAIAAVEQHEQRKYKRSPARRRLFHEIVESLLCDAMHREITEPGGRVAVSFSKRLLGRRDRYGSPVLSETLPGIIEILTATDWLTFSKGHLGFEGITAKRRSTVAAGARLRECIEKREIGLGDFTRRPGEELIVLKEGRRHPLGKSRTVDYPDDAATEKFRDEVRLINEGLEAADLGFRPSCFPGQEVDTGNRRLRRYFNEGRFDLGGRLFGGFWQGNDGSGMTRERRVGITIDGWRTVEVDFAQNALRIAYGMSGAEPPAGDLYRIPGLEDYREGIKKLFNSLLFDGAERTKYPRKKDSERIEERRTGRYLYPPHVPAKETIDRLLAHHAPVRRLVDDPEAGFRVMFIESQVMVRTLLTLRHDLGIVALPIHDAVIVREDHAGHAKDVMERSFKEIVGIPGTAKVKGY